jgi:hypothetical protein
LEGNFLPKGNIGLWKVEIRKCSVEGNQREI